MLIQIMIKNILAAIHKKGCISKLT